MNFIISPLNVQPVHRRCADACHAVPATHRLSIQSRPSGQARPARYSCRSAGNSCPPLAALTPGSNTCASNNPSVPPNTINSTASASTRASTLRLENPRVFNTASSGMRSRTACAIVLPVSRIRVKNTAAMIAPTIKPISPSCLTKARLNACSVWVLVS